MPTTRFNAQRTPVHISIQGKLDSPPMLPVEDRSGSAFIAPIKKRRWFPNKPNQEYETSCQCSDLLIAPNGRNFRDRHEGYNTSNRNICVSPKIATSFARGSARARKFKATNLDSPLTISVVLLTSEVGTILNVVLSPDVCLTAMQIDINANVHGASSSPHKAEKNHFSVNSTSGHHVMFAKLLLTAAKQTLTQNALFEYSVAHGLARVNPYIRISRF